MTAPTSNNEQPTIYRISDKQPEFRDDIWTWLWAPSYVGWCKCPHERSWNHHYWQATHWCHSPTRPTVAPEADQTRTIAEAASTPEEAERLVAAFHGVTTQPDTAPQLPAKVREVIENTIWGCVPSRSASLASNRLCAKLAPFFTASPSSPDVEKVAEEIHATLVNKYDEVMFQPATAVVKVSAILRRVLAEKDAEIIQLKAELGHLHGRIGLFAAKHALINDNLPTDETFEKLGDHISYLKGALHRSQRECNEHVQQIYDNGSEPNSEIVARAEKAEAELAALRAEVDRLLELSQQQSKTLGVVKDSEVQLRQSLASTEQRLREAEKEKERLELIIWRTKTHNHAGRAAVEAALRQDGFSARAQQEGAT